MARQTAAFGRTRVTTRPFLVEANLPGEFIFSSIAPATVPYSQLGQKKPQNPTKVASSASTLCLHERA